MAWPCTPGTLALDHAAGRSIWFAFDQIVPLVNTGGKQRCQVDTGTTAGQWYFTATWGNPAPRLGLRPLFIAGFNSIVRKT